MPVVNNQVARCVLVGLLADQNGGKHILKKGFGNFAFREPNTENRYPYGYQH